MAAQSTIARPYASAAFKQAQEENDLSGWSDMLAFLSGVVRDPLMSGVIVDPRVGVAKVTELMLSVAEGRLSRTGENFVRVLAENRRLDQLPAIGELFEQARAEFENRRMVEVVSAYEINDEQRADIQAAMSKRLGHAVDVIVRVDESLIGGAVLRVGDSVIDASMRGRLDELAATLT